MNAAAFFMPVSKKTLEMKNEPSEEHLFRCGSNSHQLKSIMDIVYPSNQSIPGAYLKQALQALLLLKLQCVKSQMVF